MGRFAEVAVALPLPHTFHYRVPDGLMPVVSTGSRVLAPFGRRGVTGVVVSTQDEEPQAVQNLKPLASVIEGPRLPASLIELCQWVASYYEAPIGEVLAAATPAGTQQSAREVVALTDLGTEALGRGALPEKLRDVLGVLSNQGGALPKARLLRSGVKKPVLDQAIQQGFIEVNLSFGGARVKKKRVRTVELAKPWDEAWTAELSRAPKRLEVLRAIAARGGPVDVPTLKGASPQLKRLAADGYVVMSERWVLSGPVPSQPLPGGKEVTLNEGQSLAVASLTAAVAADQYSGFLLHGVTGSGKTEVYLRTISAVLAAGKTAIVLVPEISLTPQLGARFRARFGNDVAVLHSGLTPRQRFDEWHRLATGKARIALGARSAVFAPVSNVGIIVVDEEHDSSFKQEEGVRYQGRDVAMVRAQKTGAVCLLGSATPSLESYHLAKTGRIELLELSERATEGVLPKVDLIDLRKYQADSDSFLTAPLAQAIEETLTAKEQVILFLNRRGFHTFVICVACGHEFRCSSCAVSLTFHRGSNVLRCHYCGHRERPVEACPSCGAESISRRGLGTERIADAVMARFPKARVLRLDRDVVSGGRDVERVLSPFAKREADILIGTQMVTKGHDFPGVTLVGVLCADTGLSLPDFRAAEKTFQLLTQVAGRAGRGDRPGRVFIQTYRGSVPAVACAKNHDYHGFLESELTVRQELGYPPFGHLVALRMDGPDAQKVERTAHELARQVGKLAPTRAGLSVLGPCEAPLARLKGRTRWHAWIRGEDRKVLRGFVKQLNAKALVEGTGVRLTLDVDPQSAL